MSVCGSCGLERLGETGYCPRCGTSLQPVHSTMMPPPAIRRGEVRQTLKRTAIGIGAIIGLLIVVAIVADLSHVPGSVRAAAAAATPSIAQAKLEAESASLDELFRDNERRVREAVDARAKIKRSVNTAENTVEISRPAALSQDRLLNNLPQKQLVEEPLGF